MKTLTLDQYEKLKREVAEANHALEKIQSMLIEFPGCLVRENASPYGDGRGQILENSPPIYRSFFHIRSDLVPQDPAAPESEVLDV
jgi:hypothetical protein